MHIEREKINRSQKEFTKGTFKIPEAFQKNYNLDNVAQGSKT